VCGIFGLIGSVPEVARDDAFTFLKHLAIASKDRGSHATGFASVHRDSPLLIEKRAVPSDKFVFACTRFKAFKQQMPTLLIGHTRHATTGHQSRGRNNHPFNSARYSLVHNGHIDDWDKLAKSHPLNLRSETDSEVIIRLIDERDTVQDGVQHMIDTVDKDSRIAIALLRHFEANNRRLYLFRKDNPIHVATVPAWRSIFFASTQEIIEKALQTSYGMMVWNARKAALNMEIRALPAWELLEFVLDGNTPHLAQRFKIEEQKTVVLTPAASATTNQTGTSRIDALLPVKSVDGQKPTERDVSGVSDETQSAVKRFERDASRVARLMNTMSVEPFMTLDEMEDWREWLKGATV
jgi:glucosamine 6-phosphate synthetase-like amidotransferase/phosphosugar isomerase protein